MHQRSLPPCLVLAILVPAATALPRIAAALRSRWLAAALAVAGVTIAPTTSEGAAPATDPAIERALDLRIEVSLDNQPQNEDLSTKIGAEVRKQLKAHGIEVAPDANASLLVVVGYPEGNRATFEVRYLLATSDGAPEKLDRWLCDACGSGDVVNHVDDALANAWPKLEAASQRSLPAAQPAASDAGPDPTPAPRPPAPQSRARRSIGPLGLAGAALGAVGLAAVGSGAVMVYVRYRYPEDNPDIRNNLRKPGIGVLAGGAALTIAGITMMAVDLTRPRRDRKVGATAALGRGHAGVVVWGRW